MTFAGFKLLLFCLVSLSLLTVGAYSGYRWERSAVLALELKYADAERKAVAAAQAEQKRLDDIGRQAAEQEAVKQQALAETAQAQLAEVQSHVQDFPASNVRVVGAVARPVCLTLGLIRVLDAAVHGTLASDLKLPAGKSDGSCSKIGPVALANSLVRNYAAANANREQLDALIAVVKQLAPKR